MLLNNWRRRALRRMMTRLGIWLLEAQPAIAQKTLPKFSNSPKQLTIELPRRIVNPEFISLGDHVWIGPGCLITAVNRNPPASLAHPEKKYKVQTFLPRIRIGHRVCSSGNLVIGAVQQVDIGDDVLLASNVTILDNLHGYDTPYEPYKYQPLQRIAPVEVKRGCWIGQNAVILPGVTVGEMSIIGANSVVTGSIPDRCIAVGAPARIIKKWDEKTLQWRPYGHQDQDAVADLTQVLRAQGS